MERREEQPERPTIFPGQMAVVVTDEGETEVREILIPPPDKKPPENQMALGISEV